jgi:hypothetical protein
MIFPAFDNPSARGRAAFIGFCVIRVLIFKPVNPPNKDQTETGSVFHKLLKCPNSDRLSGTKDAKSERKDERASRIKVSSVRVLRFNATTSLVLWKNTGIAGTET